MSISCVLGLTACLVYGGSEISAKDVVRALDTCDIARGRVTDIRLEVVAEDIEDAMDVRIRWPARSSLATKREVVLRECANIQAAFNNRRLWRNLDKWPY